MHRRLENARCSDHMQSDRHVDCLRMREAVRKSIIQL